MKTSVFLIALAGFVCAFLIHIYSFTNITITDENFNKFIYSQMGITSWIIGVIGLKALMIRLFFPSPLSLRQKLWVTLILILLVFYSPFVTFFLSDYQNLKSTEISHGVYYIIHDNDIREEVSAREYYTHLKILLKTLSAAYLFCFAFAIVAFAPSWSIRFFRIIK